LEAQFQALRRLVASKVGFAAFTILSGWVQDCQLLINFLFFCHCILRIRWCVQCQIFCFSVWTVMHLCFFCKMVVKAFSFILLDDSYKFCFNNNVLLFLVYHCCAYLPFFALECSLIFLICSKTLLTILVFVSLQWYEKCITRNG
jgi:hypothetical protein